MDQHEVVKCTLVIYVPYDAAKHRCHHHDDVNTIEIHLKTRLHSISASRFVVKHTVVDVSVCAVASSITDTTVVELTIQAAKNILVLFMQTLVFLQTTSFLD